MKQHTNNKCNSNSIRTNKKLKNGADMYRWIGSIYLLNYYYFIVFYYLVKADPNRIKYLEFDLN